ncbi:efflux RND transporter periplasmic adaptor subunit [Pseudomonas sp. NPDC007930]|uniref:efflux RND transporter periplasmic adaptor subunit n=1 Tax=Pseudomonas sp. NPDC007930 TaxID=3364417 RepID=UPI0036EDB509
MIIRKPAGLIVLCGALGYSAYALFGGHAAPPKAPVELVPQAAAVEMPAQAITTPAQMAPAQASPAAAVVAPAPASAASPAVADKPASDDAGNGQVRGVVRAVREAKLSSGMVGQVIKMPFSEGQAFKQGDLLVEFDCDKPAAELRAADAAVQVEQKTVETNQELEKFNSIGKFDLLISESKLNKAKAESQALKAQIKQCKIFAPYSGRVTERMARLYESVSVSEPLLKIVDTSALELDLIVPSKWMQWLKPDTAFSFRVDETGQTGQAVVDRLLPAVDPVSKTVKIIGRFSGKANGSAIPGMSGTARFDDSLASRP